MYMYNAADLFFKSGLSSFCDEVTGKTNKLFPVNLPISEEDKKYIDDPIWDKSFQNVYLSLVSVGNFFDVDCSRRAFENGYVLKTQFDSEYVINIFQGLTLGAAYNQIIMEYLADLLSKEVNSTWPKHIVELQYAISAYESLVEATNEIIVAPEIWGPCENDEDFTEDYGVQMLTDALGYLIICYDYTFVAVNILRMNLRDMGNRQVKEFEEISKAFSNNSEDVNDANDSALVHLLYKLILICAVIHRIKYTCNEETDDLELMATNIFNFIAAAKGKLGMFYDKVKDEDIDEYIIRVNQRGKFLDKLIANTLDKVLDRLSEKDEKYYFTKRDKED